LAQEQEIEFILETSAQYLDRAPTRADVLSVFTGIRPLVATGSASTAALSRDHTIHIDQTGLLTLVGGKWTTYRRMAEDGVNQAAMLGRLRERACITQDLPIHRYPSDLEWSEPLHAALPYSEAEIVRAAREEMARTVEDCLARRTRALFLNAKAAVEMAPRVAAILARELNRDSTWQQDQVAQFTELARGYQLS
jgi:glycerol-3-phosphate dehydrogenase